MKDLKVPEVITIDDTIYLGIVNQEKNIIEYCFETDEDELDEKTFKNYLKAHNIGFLNNYKVSPNQSYISRCFNEKELMLWDLLVNKFLYVKKTAIRKLENNYWFLSTSSHL